MIMKVKPEKRQLILALIALFIFCLHLNGEVLNLVPRFGFAGWLLVKALRLQLHSDAHA
jgi:hypothetical protein